MRLAVAVLSLALLGLMLAEFFVVFLLPRRVKREPRIARGLLLVLWRPWRAAAARLPRIAGDTMLGIFGPVGLLAVLTLLSVGVIAGFTGLHWAHRSHVGTHSTHSVGEALYFSAGSFFSASTPFVSGDGLAKLLQVAEAATGFGVVFIAIGYLPALFESFSRREAAVAQLDPRAGSPPTAGALLEHSGRRGGWAELDEYLERWEPWTAELMETHLSYPLLGYFRSQHLNQNWLAAMITVVDASAFCLAYAPDESVDAAEFTFAIGRHALADLAYAFRVTKVRDVPDRLPPEALAELRSRLEGTGLHPAAGEEARERLAELRRAYEPNAIALARHLALPLPGWLPSDDAIENWRVATARRRGRGRAPLP